MRTALWVFVGLILLLLIIAPYPSDPPAQVDSSQQNSADNSSQLSDEWVSPEQAERIRSAANLVGLQNDNDANVDEAIRALGSPSSLSD